MMRSAPVLLLLLISATACVHTLAQYTAANLSPRPYGHETELQATGGNVSNYDKLRLRIGQVTGDGSILRVRVEPAVGETPLPHVLPSWIFQQSAFNESIPWSSSGPINVTQENTTTGDISLTDATSQAVLFAIRPSSLSFQPQFVSLTFDVPLRSYVSGYGEHNYYYYINSDAVNNKGDVDLALWNTDDGTPWHAPLYGVHPVVFVANPLLNAFYAIFFANSNGQALHIANSTSRLTFKFVGGIIDAFVVRGHSMLDVIRRYHKSVIRPTMVPPYWALGTHQCSWGYHTLDITMDVVANYSRNDLPLEVIWNDIDYMDRYRIFTTDPQRFPTARLAEFVAMLHVNEQHYVQIVDPGVAVASDYDVYQRGIKQNAFVDVTLGNGSVIPLTNIVWPGWTNFPDFTSATSREWWSTEMNIYFQKVPIDGVWLDMNEISSFCPGRCIVDDPSIEPVSNWSSSVWPLLRDVICPRFCSVDMNSSLNTPPFNPLSLGEWPDWHLYNKTYDLTAQTAAGRYYDTKTFMGMSEGMATHAALLNRSSQSARPPTRPFILSRSTFAGGGAFVAHWTGDNNAAWGRTQSGIVDSIQGVLASNLMGVAMVGADIGGFSGGNAVDHGQLVTRWTQLGAFYTFMRNHRDNHETADGTTGQEPYRYAPDQVEAMRQAMLQRYHLLPYLFSELVKAHYNGGPVLRHPSAQYPGDALAYSFGDSESTPFFYGDDIFVVPVVTENATNVTAYVPGGPWYSLNVTTAGLAAPVQLINIDGTGQSQTFNVPDVSSPIPVFARAGSALLLHARAELTVAATRRSGLAVACYLNASGLAAGELWLDNGADPLLDNGPDADLIASIRVSCEGSLGGGGTVKLEVTHGNSSWLPWGVTQLRLYDGWSPVVVANQTVAFQRPPNGTVSPTAAVMAVPGGFVATFAAQPLPRGTDGVVVFSWAPVAATSSKAELVFPVLFGVAVLLLAAAITWGCRNRRIINDRDLKDEFSKLNP